MIHADFLAFCLVQLGFGEELFGVFWPGVCHSSLGDTKFSQGVGESGIYNRFHCLLGVYVVFTVFHMDEELVGAGWYILWEIGKHT